MTTQQTEEGAGQALEDSAMACIARGVNFWWVHVEPTPDGPRWFAVLTPWDDDRPEPRILAREGCASYDTMMARATALNEERVRGGTGA